MPKAAYQDYDIKAPSGLVRYTTARLKYAHEYRSSAASRKAQMVAFPERRSRLKKELLSSRLLGETSDGKKIFLFDASNNSGVMRELGRLRELSFRAVGEGTGKLRDTDKYDRNYRHIILWDDASLDIVGAYRIGEAFKPTLRRGVEKGNSSYLYTRELFEYGDKFETIFTQSIELGRSFVQPKYWKKRSLDCLWQGIGAYLKAHPQVRYLFGAVSISNDYPNLAKHQIVGLYRHFFTPPDAQDYVRAKRPFQVDRGVLESYRRMNFKESTLFLKKSLMSQGVTLPTLYKHYADFCEEDGIKFLDFNIDPDFSYCIDGLILVDLQYIKENKRKRYLEPH